MDTAPLFASLERTALVLPPLYEGRDPEDLRWRPKAGSWSLLEILGHLLDEEVHDFRARVRSTLEDPERPWEPIDPEGWVTERRYQAADPAATLAAWRRERAASLAWLRGLSAPDWDRAWTHPRAGRLRAGDVLLSWVAHDHLHLAQIARVTVAWTKVAGLPYSTDYAGA